MIFTTPSPLLEEVQRRTGWVLGPNGACRGPVCVPLRPPGPTVDLRWLADGLGMGLAHDEQHGLWALGPSTVSGRALESVETPDFALPDLEGRPLRVSSLRGRKVVLIAWASW